MDAKNEGDEKVSFYSCELLPAFTRLGGPLNEYPLFRRDFTTAPGTSWLDISFTAETSVYSTASQGAGIAFQCVVYQDSNANGVIDEGGQDPDAAAFCPGHLNGFYPWLFFEPGLTPDFGSHVTNTYSGFVGASPSTLTRVKISSYGQDFGTGPASQGLVCQQILKIGY